MKKIIFFLLLVPTIVLGSSFFSLPVKASEELIRSNTQKISLTSDKNNAIADGQDKITFTFSHFAVGKNARNEFPNASDSNPVPYCLMYYGDNYSYSPGSFAVAKSTGENNNLQTSQTNSGTNGSISLDNVFNCSAGQAEFSLSSTKEEEKTVTVYVQDYHGDEADVSISLNVSFMVPVNPTPETPNETTPTPATVIDKASISISSVVKTSGSGTTMVATSANPTLQTGDKLTVTGTSADSAKITLTIASIPITVETVADNSGNWSYTIDPKNLKLAYGDHTVSAIAEVNGQKSDSKEATKFTYREVSSSPLPIQNENNSVFTAFNLIMSGIVVILLAVLVFIIIKRKKLRKG